MTHTPHQRLARAVIRSACNDLDRLLLKQNPRWRSYDSAKFLLDDAGPWRRSLEFWSNVAGLEAAWVNRKCSKAVSKILSERDEAQRAIVGNLVVPDLSEHTPSVRFEGFGVSAILRRRPRAKPPGSVRGGKLGAQRRASDLRLRRS